MLASTEVTAEKNMKFIQLRLLIIGLDFVYISSVHSLIYTFGVATFLSLDRHTFGTFGLFGCGFYPRIMSVECVFFLFTNRFSIIRDDMLSIEFRISSSRFCCCDLKPFDLTRQQDCLWYGLCHSLQTKYPQHMSGECTHFVSH